MCCKVFPAVGAFFSLLATCSLAGVLSPTPDWMAYGEQEQSHLGWAIATAGDVNGDGYSDVVVGAYSHDTGSGRGIVYLYHGSANGLSMVAGWTGYAASNDGNYGAKLATAGDVNGDGYSDVLVGADNANHGDFFMGTAYLYHGSPDGLSFVAEWSDQGTIPFGYFGCSLATAGDVDGDGYSDVLVGYDGYENGESGEGAVFLYSGGPGSLAPDPVWVFEGDRDGAYLGNSVSTAGDVNADGFSDVIIGVRGLSNPEVGEGAAYVFHGGSPGFPAAPDWVVEGDADHFQLGESVSTAGDVNGDGYADVIVGLRGYENGQSGEGAAMVFHGSASGLEGVPAWTAEGDQESACFGYKVSTAGDLNGDGYSDVAVGAIFYDNGEMAEGAGFAYLGSAGGLMTQPAWSAEGEQVQAFYGVSIGLAGDVNGDGFSDLVAGAGMFDEGTGDEGAAYLYHGSGEGPSDVAAWTAEGGQSNAHFGHNAMYAGDVNGDGFADVVVGAHNYGNDQFSEGAVFLYLGSAAGLASVADWAVESNQSQSGFGNSVAGAGDVNGDGFADVIVGAFLFDNATLSNNGRACVYFGSPQGLSPEPDWQAECDQAESYFAWTVNGVGDLNGDGYTDVAVGARQFTNPDHYEGAAFVYLGGADGPSLEPDWQAEGDLAEAQYGERVASAGDVNGDGYFDLAVGARLYANGQNNEGRVYVYFGGPDGPSPVADWTAEGDHGGAWFGHWLSTAGDVNGDGYSDLAVGARQYAVAGDSIGWAVVYHGGPDGLSELPDWQVFGSQHGEALGDCIGTAGDVNGDGYSDLLLTAEGFSNPENREGRVALYLGGPGGLADQPVWTLEGDQDSAFLGDYAGTAGDINADGFDDFLVSADRYNNGQDNEGKVWLFYGNHNPGVSVVPRQLTVAWDRLVQPLAATGATDSVSIMLRAQTPAGRTRARLIWEVKPLGEPFDGSAVGRGAFQDAGISGPDLGQLVSGLNPGTPYHWRARLQYFPHMNYTKWVSGGGPNAWSETDFRTSVVCVPTGNSEEACDGVDDDCDGLTDEDAAVACDDGLACTADECQNGKCIHEISTGSCLIGNSCLADGEVHPEEPCLACRPEISRQEWSSREPGTVCGEAICLDGLYTAAPTCDAYGVCVPGSSVPCPSGECASSSECAGAQPGEGYLWVTLGDLNDPGTRVSGGSPAVVLRLNLDTEGVAGTLDSLRLVFPGLGDAPTYWRWVQVSLYADRGMSGQVDSRAELLGRSWLQNGEVFLSGLGLNLPAMRTTSVLVALAVVEPLQEASGALWFPFGLILLLGLIPLLLPDRRKFRLVLLVLLFLALHACSRYGYYRTYYFGHAELQSDEDVGVSAHPGDTLNPRGAPLAGNRFALDISR